MNTLPRYFIGTYQTHLDLAAGKVLDANQNPIHVGAYFGWTTDPTQGTSPYFIVMRDRSGTPHPDWVPLPHILDSTPIKSALMPPSGPIPACVTAACTQAMCPMTANDTTYSFAMKLHAHYPVFEP